MTWTEFLTRQVSTTTPLIPIGQWQHRQESMISNSSEARNWILRANDHCNMLERFQISITIKNSTDDNHLNRHLTNPLKHVSCDDSHFPTTALAHQHNVNSCTGIKALISKLLRILQRQLKQYIFGD